MNDINPAIMGLLAPGQERHYVFPVYDNGKVFFCLTEMRDTDQETCEITVYRIFEAFTEEELDWLNENCSPSGCGHELVSWLYWLNTIAYDLIQAYLEGQKQDPFDALDPVELRTDLDNTLNNILGR